MLTKSIANDTVEQLEAQAKRFYEAARACQRHQSIELAHGGFELNLRYIPNLCYSREQHLGEVLTIAGVYVPEQDRGQGVFWRLCKYCLGLAERGVAIGVVMHEGLYDALKRNPDFIETTPRDFLCLKEVNGKKPMVKLPDYSLLFDMFAAGKKEGIKFPPSSFKI